MSVTAFKHALPVIMYKYLIKTINFACVCSEVLLRLSCFPVLIVNLSILNHFNLTLKILFNSWLIEIFCFNF